MTAVLDFRVILEVRRLRPRVAIVDRGPPQRKPTGASARWTRAAGDHGHGQLPQCAKLGQSSQDRSDAVVAAMKLPDFHLDEFRPAETRILTQLAQRRVAPVHPPAGPCR